MPRQAIRIAYDGRPFRGYQRQPDVRTVEAAIFEACDALLDRRIDHEHPPLGYTAAGRTDAGVSALAQTISIDAPEWLGPTALNGALPDAVRAWARASVDDGFHARHDAVEREYTFVQLAPEFGDGELTRLREALESVSGTHDFHNLTPDALGTERSITATAEREDPFILIVVRGEGFPRQLVRRLVTLVMGVASGRRPIADVQRALAPESLPGPAGIAPASPDPLVLTNVRYQGLEWEPDTEGAPSEEFHRRQGRARTRARVLGLVGSGVRRSV